MEKIDKHLYEVALNYANKLSAEKINIISERYQRNKIMDGLANSFGEQGRTILHVINEAANFMYKKEDVNDMYNDVLKKEHIKGRLLPTAYTVIRLAREAGAHFWNRKKEENDNNSSLAFEIIQEKYPAVFDTLSQDVLVKGQQINDTVINTILVDLMANHCVYTTKDYVQSVLESSFTEKVNQFEDFVEKYADRATYDGGSIEKLADCIKSRTGKSLGFDYKLHMIRLFLIKMIAQVFENTPNDLCLILLGGQYIGKTEFFKQLLPEELLHMFSVQVFRGDKDAKRDAARYLLILDDEFRGLKMATSEALKSQLSMTTINLRVPYGRKPHPFKRIASYCAVSNERFILKDPTGNRRLVCFWVDSIDWELYNSIDKTDLLIEAYHYYQMGYGHKLDRDILKAISVVSREFEVSTSAEEILLQFLPPSDLNDTSAKWRPVSDIIHEVDKTHGTKLSEYEVGKALRKLDYKHKYISVNGSKLLCWLVKEGNTKMTNFQNRIDSDGFL